MLRLVTWSSVALFAAACSRPAPRLPSAPERTEAWSRDCVETMASTPLQDNGRIKPLATLAAFTLYYVHGRRDLQFTTAGPDGKDHKITLEPTEWLLDVFAYPRQAAQYPLFRIENSAVLDALGFANDGQQLGFEFLSYDQVFGVVDKLQDLAQSYLKIDEQQRSVEQQHLVLLWRRFLTYHRLHTQLDALRFDVDVRGDALRKALGGERVRLGAILQNASAFRELVRAAGPKLESGDGGDSNLVRVIEFLTQVVEHDRDGAGLIPPPPKSAAGSDPASTAWLTLGGAVDQVVSGAEGDTLAALIDLQAAVTADSVAGKEAALRGYRDAVVRASAGLGRQGDVELETYYYRASWHYQSIHWFLLAFALAAGCWLLPRNRLLWWASMGVTALALGMLSYDVVLRCLITGRPPIKNLYDTFLFIAAVGVLLAMIVEFVLPRRIALAAAPFLGALLVMFARLFEVSKGEDTMDPLVAVLDSNFWLATHVTTINIGYGAGLVAALFANAWIALRVLRIAHPADATAKSVVRMTYGATCFGLAFAVVGTILGGVWANDSWGRFWGWDPKENGALLICLSQVALLHARMSGMVRDFGFVVWAALTGMVVLFSWFHVNLLGVGLHSYGFSSGLRDAVWWGYVTQLGFVAVGAIDVLLRPDPAPFDRHAREPAPLPVSGS